MTFANERALDQSEDESKCQKAGWNWNAVLNNVSSSSDQTKGRRIDRHQRPPSRRSCRNVRRVRTLRTAVPGHQPLILGVSGWDSW